MTDASAATADLAELIGRVFFELDGDAPIPSADQLSRLDGAFSAAIDSLEAHVDALGEELAAAVFVLLRDVRNGIVDRTTGRVTAEVLVRHVAAVVGVVSVEPLIRFLGALAVLPDGPEVYERALDPSPDPSSEIEVAMAAVFDDPGARSMLRRALLTGSLLVPVIDLGVAGRELSLQFLPVVVRGMPMISVFTSRERVAEHAAAAGVGEIPLVEIDGDELSTICPAGHGTAINPGWVLGCVLEELEVRSLPNAPALATPDDVVELSAAVHPAVVGAIDGVRPQLSALGVADLVAASRGPDLVIAVVADDHTAPEQALRRAGAALADRGLEGPVLVPATSPMGAAVLAVAR